MIVLGSDSRNYEAEVISASTNKWYMSVWNLDSGKVPSGVVQRPILPVFPRDNVKKICGNRKTPLKTPLSSHEKKLIPDAPESAQKPAKYNSPHSSCSHNASASVR